MLQSPDFPDFEREEGTSDGKVYREVSFNAHDAAFRIMPTGGSQGDARSGDWRVFIAA